MPGKKTLEEVKESYSKEGYEFLDIIYVNSGYKHSIRCSFGHFIAQRYNAFQSGQRCKKCSLIYRSQKRTLSLEFIKNKYKTRGFEFLDETYLGNRHLHNIKCSKHHIIWRQRYNDFQKGCGCQECKREKQKSTCLIKYSCENPFGNNKIKDKIRETNLKKYGCEHPQHNINIKEKTKATNNKSYGGNNPICDQLVRNKSKQTCLENYGVEYPSQNREIALKQARSANKLELHYHWLTGEEIWTQGSYEANTIYDLNNKRINYLWQPKVFKLANGKTYRPDMYLPDEDKWIEVKGFFRKDAKEKWDEFHNTIMLNSELWDAIKLKEMGVL